MVSKGIYYIVEQQVYSRGDLMQRTGTASLSWLTSLPPGVILAKDRGYVFRFVGLLTVESRLVVMLPKYMADRSEEELVRKDEVRQLMQVLRLYNDQNAGRLATEDSNDDPENFFNEEPAVAMALIDNYLENGYWSKSEQVITQNGGVRVDWQRTMDRTMPLVSDNGVLYPATYSVRQQTFTDSAILQLHRWAVRYCLETYQDLLPGFDRIDYDMEATENLEELGDRSYFITLLEQELRISYLDVRIQTLRLLLQLINESTVADDEVKISLFGTTVFHRIWEQACKAVFGDLSSRISKLPIPEWSNDEGIFINKDNKLIPDAVWFDEKHLLILDAKYYNVKFKPGRVLDNPGMPDVLKQLVYENAVAHALELTDATIVNAFVLPRSNVHGDAGTQSDWLWGWIDSKIPIFGKKYIAVLLIPPAEIFRYYLYRTHIVNNVDLVSYLSMNNPS